MTSDEHADRSAALSLSTKVEEDFVAPLAAMRGALEILRDYPDLGAPERQRFLATALGECARLEQGVKDLAATVYAAARQSGAKPDTTSRSQFAGRIKLDHANGIAEIDFSDFEFSSSALVNSFFDAIDQTLTDSGHRWYLLVNFRDCSIWPEAWVAYAHRSKKVNVQLALGSVRYVETDRSDGPSDPSILPTRAAALDEIAALKAAQE